MAVDWWSFGAPISKGFLQAALLGLQQQQAVQAQQRDYADWVQRTLYRYQLEAPEREAAARRAQLAESAARINLLAERAQSDPKNQTLLAALNQAYQEANLPGLPTQTIPGPVLQPAMRLPMGVARAEGQPAAIPELRGPATQQFTTYTPPRSLAEIRQQRLDYQAFLRQKVYAYVTDPKSVDWPTLKQQMREAGMIPTAELQQAREAYRAANQPRQEVETPRDEYNRLTAEVRDLLAWAAADPTAVTFADQKYLTQILARIKVLTRRLFPPSNKPVPQTRQERESRAAARAAYRPTAAPTAPTAPGAVQKTITWQEIVTLARANGVTAAAMRKQWEDRGYTVIGTP